MGSPTPAKQYVHRGNIDLEFENVFDHLSKIGSGPFRLMYSKTYDALYLVVKAVNGNSYTSVMKIDRDGVFSTTGAHNASATLENPPFES
jgi:hypothetical protein